MVSTYNYILERKAKQGQDVIRQAMERWRPEETAIAWTGGKDSTLVLWLWRRLARDRGLPLPTVFTIDEHDTFPEVQTFMAEVAAAWGIDLVELRNREVVDAAGGELGAPVIVERLDARNRAEVERLGFSGREFLLEAESRLGNHLLKTVPLNRFIAERGIQALVQGLRRDEHPARAQDQPLDYRQPDELSPGHWRINPILELTEREVWEITLERDVPHNPLYAQGYRSLGAKSTTAKSGETPAWEQCRDGGGERDGRHQDKEAAMAQLRALGYM